MVVVVVVVIVVVVGHHNEVRVAARAPISVQHSYLVK